MWHLWETVTQKKFGAPFLLQWLVYRQYKHLSDSVPVMDGKWLVNKVSSISPLSPCPGGRGAWQDDLKLDNKRREFIFIITITVISCFLEKGQQTSTTIQPCTHRPQKERDGSPERSLLSKCLIHLALAENRHFNMTSMFIHVSFST